MSYHNGSVWPHDNALIARGLARYGHKRGRGRITHRAVRRRAHLHLRRLPELFCGCGRRHAPTPSLYPGPCAAGLGRVHAVRAGGSPRLEVDAAAECVRLRQPRLPAFVDWLVVRRLCVGDSRLDLVVRRHGSSVAVNLLERQGAAEVEVVY